MENAPHILNRNRKIEAPLFKDEKKTAVIEIEKSNSINNTMTQNRVIVFCAMVFLSNINVK